MTIDGAISRMRRRLYEGKDGDHEDIHIAIKAMERRNPRKPFVNFIPDRTGHYRYDMSPAYTVVQCQICKTRLRLNKKPDNFCGKCGQAIDWTGITSQGRCK